MAWGEWMVINPSLQQELELEKSIRCIAASEDTAKVRDLCASLLRQNWFQQQLIRQATGHIAQLEMQEFLGCASERPGLVQRLLGRFRRCRT
jgi:hypothetical protein